jgi:hypothetical protein
MLRFLVGVSCAIACAAIVPTRSATSAETLHIYENATTRDQPDFTDRATLIAALERLMLTGEPSDTSHDDGQLLQWGVEAAIARGDAEVERLAIRAATPLIPDVETPISPTQDLPSFGVSSRKRLSLPHPVPYTAAILASVDGEPFVKVAQVSEGKGTGQRIDQLFSERARQPGFHHVRSRAQVTFTSSSGSGWTEERVLADVAYALYDRDGSEQGARVFVDAARLARPRDLDPSSSDVSAEATVDAWLQQLIARPETNAERRVDWKLQFCAERTSNAFNVRTSGDLCMVAYMQAQNDIERIWIRTGRLLFDGDGPHWQALAPALVGVSTSHRGAPTSSLSGLARLLATSHDAWPEGDTSVGPDDIAVVVDTKGTADINVTVRNVGSADLYGVHLYVGVGGDSTQRVLARNFVIDIPARDAKSVSLAARLQQGYGFVMAHALQAGEQSPHDAVSFDPTPEDACAIRIVNPRVAPPEFTRGIVESSAPCRVH